VRLSIRALVRRGRRDDGASAVEFALIAPVIVALLLGIIQFGFVFFEYIQVAHAAREGVRWAALGEIAQVNARAVAAAPGLDAANLNITILPGASADAIQVQASYPVTRFVPASRFFPTILPAQIVSVAEERIE